MGDPTWTDADLYGPNGRSEASDIGQRGLGGRCAAIVLRTGRSAIALFFLTVAGCATTPVSPVRLDDLPISESFSPRAALNADYQAQDQATFIADVANKVKGEGYRIADRRIFRCVGYVPAIGPQWVVLHAEVGNTLMETFKGREVYDHIDSHGPHTLSIWRLPHRQTIAMAQSFDLPDGAVLVGYFMLEKQ